MTTADKPASEASVWFIPRENLDRADRNCDLGDSVSARIYKYPHKDDGHVGLVERSAFDAVVRERDHYHKAYADENSVCIELREQVARLEAELAEVNQLVLSRERWVERVSEERDAAREALLKGEKA